ncbi:MAG: YhcH/YjgK/YiaL family protein, partial [Veillonella sp.]|nr:YhcH/YjgK/YiaL family protein [Veillonella sp.]
CPEGYYTVFFPSDIHRPLLAVNDKPIKIRKVVVKVHVDLLGD